MTDPRRALPAVHAVLDHQSVRGLVDDHGREVVTEWVRAELAALRENSGAEATAEDLLSVVAAQVAERATSARAESLGRVINATGVVLHTGLGRAPLSERALFAIRDVAGAGNVELDLATGERRHRGHQLLPALARLTGCEDALVVNNNAAATLLVLTALCAGREVVISRGQLIEIGGSFRLPEIFELGGVTLREVGTTNRTTVADYERAIGERTAAILRVHPSNYRIDGFAATPEIEDLVPLAHGHGLLCIDDIGSGCLTDTTAFGLPAEPTFGRSITAGADVVLGSGDKLLGGPQAGIIVGSREALDRIRSHPYARTVRTDKTTLAGLAGTLESYLLGREGNEIPVLAMLGTSVDSLRSRAERIVESLASTRLTTEVRDDVATVGGGSLPGAELPTIVVAITHPERSAGELARRLRVGIVRVVPRVRDETVLLDLRSVRPEEDDDLAAAIRAVSAN